MCTHNRESNARTDTFCYKMQLRGKIAEKLITLLLHTKSCLTNNGNTIMCHFHLSVNGNVFIQLFPKGFTIPGCWIPVYQFFTHGALSPLPGKHTRQSQFIRRAHTNLTTITITFASCYAGSPFIQGLL